MVINLYRTFANDIDEQLSLKFASRNRLACNNNGHQHRSILELDDLMIDLLKTSNPASAINSM